MQREIQDAAYRYQREVEDRARIVVGVNEYVTDESPPTNLFEVDPAVGDALAEKLVRVRAKRERGEAESALDALEAAARGSQNVVACIVRAVEAHVTLGEICDQIGRASCRERVEIEVGAVLVERK